MIENSEAIHNLEAIKQLFKKIIDNFGIIMSNSSYNSSMFSISNNKNANQLK